MIVVLCMKGLKFYFAFECFHMVISQGQSDLISFSCISIRFCNFLCLMLNFLDSQIKALTHSLVPRSEIGKLSYQEQKQLQVIENYVRFFENIKSAYQLSPHSRIYEKLINEYSSLGNSLWAQAGHILQSVQSAAQNPDFCLAHLHYHSEAPLLAIYARITGHRVRLIGSKDSLEHGWAQATTIHRSVDRKTDCRNIIVAEGIDVLFMEDIDGQDEIENIDDSKQTEKKILNIDILDLFNINPTVYRPYLLSYFRRNRPTSNYRRVIYVHPSQAEEVTQYINSISGVGLDLLDVSLSYPFEFLTLSDSKMETELIAFLLEEANHPNKQDIIIFHQPDEQFLKRIKHAVKKSQSDLARNVRIIDKPLLEETRSPLPCPIFMSKEGSTMVVQTQTLSRIKGEHTSTISEPESTPSESHILLKAQELGNKNTHTQNQIFVVPNFSTLQAWNYDLSHVFLVFDWRQDSSFYFDYQMMAYSEASQDFVTPKEVAFRTSCMGMHNIGKYCEIVISTNDEAESIAPTNLHIDLTKVRDIGYYVLEMINQRYKLLNKEAEDNTLIKSCIKALADSKIIASNGENLQILKPQLLKLVRKAKELNPIMCFEILTAKNSQGTNQLPTCQIAMLLAMATSIMMTPGSMRQVANNLVANRPSEIWRLSGYLHSALDILVRAKIIENREKQQAHRKSKRSVSKRLSKHNSFEYEAYGNMFEIITATRMKFDEMTIEDLLRQHLVNEAVFYRIVDTTEKICQILDLNDFSFSSFDQIKEVVAVLMKNTSNAIGIYSGSRRIGYFVKNEPNGIFPSKDSLISILNERPSNIYITRLACSFEINGDRRYEILMSNIVDQVQVMDAIGSLPNRKTVSYGQSQVQYHGVSSATFRGLWRNEGADIEQFQLKHSCFVEPNEEIALISIHCSKEKTGAIKEQFDALLKRIKEKAATQTKLTHFLGATSLLIRAGGNIEYIVKDKYINKCAVTNLDLSVQVPDLEELFEQFFVLKSVKVVRQPSSAPFKTAYIEFQTQKDFYRFHEYYNDCLYLGRIIKVSGIESLPSASGLKEQMFLQFVWNAWKSSRKALVEFQNPEDAFKCWESLATTDVDNAKVKGEIKNKNQLYLDGLNVLTDEITLERAFQNYGKIRLVELLKTPTRQNTRSLEVELQSEIRSLFGEVQVDISVGSVEKLKNGLRRCKVAFKNQQALKDTVVKTDGKTGIIGIGRVHVTSRFIYPVKVPHGYLNLYEQISEQVLGKIPNNKLRIENSISNQQQYIVASSNKKEEIDIFKAKINLELKGENVGLTPYESNILLTEVGIKNLIEIEEKYNCRLVADLGKKTLDVIALSENMKSIKQQIKAKVEDSFFYRISLNQKSFKHFKENPEAWQNMKELYKLKQIRLEEVDRSILLEGNGQNVEKVFNYLMHIVESLSKPSEEEMLNMDVCGICCEQPFRPYRLQQCGHKFCFNCLIDSVNMALGDMSVFPIKCPQCLAEVVISDLNEMLNPEMWVKLTTMALNQYVGHNSEIVSTCYTPGCKQVNFLIKTHFKCDQCAQTYCTSCQLAYHPGLTCQQAKEGGNAAFERYLKQNGIRKCPNPNCKMPIERIDGCYRVTCNRCDKSMCFKCEPDKMIPYDHYNDCYKHLTDVHGGYW